MLSVLSQMEISHFKIVRVRNNPEIIIPDEQVISKIYLIRGKKIMLDEDLAQLYQIDTRRLNEQVKRNNSRFPEDFMFQLSREEFENLMSQFATSSQPAAQGWGGRRKLPYAFTEQGVAMLSGVLKTAIAIRVHIQIIRIFAKLKEILVMHKDILLQLEKIENKLTGHDEDLQKVFKYLKQLLNSPQVPRRKIGFRRSNEN